MCTAEFTTALLPLSKTWKPPWCPARDEWRRNMGYSHTMADHSAGTKDAIQPFVTTRMAGRVLGEVKQAPGTKSNSVGDRKSTRLNSSHANISYAVFCLKKKTFFVIITPLQVSSMSSFYDMTMTLANVLLMCTLSPLLATPANRFQLFLRSSVPPFSNGL